MCDLNIFSHVFFFSLDSVALAIYYHIKNRWGSTSSNAYSADSILYKSHNVNADSGVLRDILHINWTDCNLEFGLVALNHSKPTVYFNSSIVCLMNVIWSLGRTAKYQNYKIRRTCYHFHINKCRKSKNYLRNFKEKTIIKKL